MKATFVVSTLAYATIVATAAVPMLCYPAPASVANSALSSANAKASPAGAMICYPARTSTAISTPSSSSSSTSSVSSFSFSSSTSVPSTTSSSTLAASSTSPSSKPSAVAGIQWSLEKSSNPSTDELDAYTKIEAAMTAAAARHARLGTAKKTIDVRYSPGVPTAQAGYDGVLEFGSNRVYMTERTALHEIGHTLGVGTTSGFDSMCSSGNWTTALPLLQSFDGSSAKINCGGGHFWPYGLNYDTEWSETNADRNVLMLNAMIKDGM